jgi:nucleoside-diphosphate-sugar epimerase
MILHSEEELDEFLARPSDADRLAMSRLTGVLLLAGAGGKMGPSLAERARRAAPDSLRIVAVARFSEPGLRRRLERQGIETITADLLESGAIAKLPDAGFVINLAARKFGTAGDSSATWATNTVLPGLLAQRYAGSKIISWSTGNVYPLVPVSSGGCTELTPPAPVGEYGQSAYAREKTLDYFSRRYGTPLLLLRLNYAIDLRYGVLVDIARKVYARQPVDVTMGYANVVWQGDANSVCLRAFDLCASPAAALNVTGQETLAVRDIAARFGEAFGISPQITGTEAPDALLNNASACWQRFGPPQLSVDRMIEMIAHWIRSGGALWSKPTHFEVRDGRF